MPEIIERKPAVTRTPIGGSGNYMTEGFTAAYLDVARKGEQYAAQSFKPFADNIYRFKLPGSNYFLEFYSLNSANKIVNEPYYSTLLKLIFQPFSFENYSRTKYTKLFTKYQFALNYTNYKPTPFQRKTFIEILRSISRNLIVDIEALNIKVSGDDELLIIKQNERGLHYLIVCENVGEVFYGFSGNSPGDYFTRKLERDFTSIDELVNFFLS